MTDKKLRGIYKRGKVFWFTHGSGTDRVQVSLETEDYGQAVQKALAILELPVLPSQGYQAEVIKFAAYQVNHVIWTKDSARVKRMTLKMFGEEMGWEDLASIGTKEVQAWYDRERTRVKDITVEGYLMTLQSLFSWAIVQKLIRTNPCQGLDRVKTPPGARKKFCSFEQRDQIVAEAANEHLKFILLCGFEAGMRKDEIVEARPDWFDLEHRHIHIQTTPTFTVKDKEDRTVPMSNAFYRFLKKYGLRSPFMLYPEKAHGKSRYRYDFRFPFAKHLKAMGLVWVTPHVMRHTFASLLAINGVSIYKIAKWLGDTLATTEKHYAHLAPQDEDIEFLTTPRKSGKRERNKQFKPQERKVSPNN